MLYREAVIKKLERAETHNRLGVDVPLVVSKQPSPGFRAGVLHCAQEDIDRRIAAPLQLVLIRSDQVEEAATIARRDTLEARVIASGDVAHFSLMRRNGDTITVTCANVRHIDTEDPEQPFTFVACELRKRFNELSHLGIRVRRISCTQAFPERPTKNRENSDLRVDRLLQEDHLKLDGVFDGVAIVFARDSVRGGRSEPLHEFDVHFCVAQWSPVRLSRETELFGRTVMRGSQNDKRSLAKIGCQPLVRRGVALDSAERTHVRRRDTKELRCEARRRDDPEILTQLPRQLSGISRISRSRVSGVTVRGVAKLFVA